METINSKEQNQEIILANHPSGVPTTDTFRINNIDMPEIKEGEMLLKSIYVSVDPGMRGFMNKGDDDADGNKAAIRAACPNGVDIFFDNVGGAIFDAVFANINRHARIAICGQIADYNESNPPQGLRPMHALIKKSARMESFVVYDFKDKFDDAKQQIADWYDNGDIIYKENLIEGFENIPDAFIGLFSGENIGKQMIKVGEVEEY